MDQVTKFISKNCCWQISGGPNCYFLLVNGLTLVFQNLESTYFVKIFHHGAQSYIIHTSLKKNCWLLTIGFDLLPLKETVIVISSDPPQLRSSLFDSQQYHLNIDKSKIKSFLKINPQLSWIGKPQFNIVKVQI